MDDGYPLWSLFIFLAFTMLYAVFYGFEAAIQGLNESSLEKDAAEGDKKAEKLLHIIDKPVSLMNTIQIVTNLIGIVTGAFVLKNVCNSILQLVLSKNQGLPSGAITMLMVAVVILLILLQISFGVMIPKKCAAKNPQKWAYGTLPLISAISIPVYPFMALVGAFSHLVLRIIGIDPNSVNDNVTEEEIRSMVNEGHEQGVLLASEAEMITNIFEFGDKEAWDIMTHRKNMVALSAAMTLKEATQFILKESNSRFPVYEKDIDDIVGILHLKDAVIYAEKEELEDMPIAEIEGLLREAHFIPETRNINLLFKEMQSQKIHMEVVVDEYGQTAGIVTMEDILEEIVGKILDEYDEEDNFITLLEDGTFIIKGATPLEEVTEVLDLEFIQDDYDTINGFLISKLDRIPQEGEELVVNYEGYEFSVNKVENKMIHTVSVIKLEQTEPDNGMIEENRQSKRDASA